MSPVTPVPQALVKQAPVKQALNALRAGRGRTDNSRGVGMV
jgi:hypothetical protein